MACWGNPKGGSGIWNGEGLGRIWGGGDQFTSNLGQGGWDRTTQREGFHVSERGIKREPARGAKRGVCAMSILSICICVYNNCPNVINNLNFV